VIRRQNEQTGLVWYEFAPPNTGFRHAVLTRLGGASQGPYSTLNLGSTVGDDPDAVKENHRRVYENFDLDAARVVSPHQVHKNHVACVESRHGRSIIPATDALITNAPGVVLLLRFADCVPVVFYDPIHHAAGLAHAGWRGIAAGVLPACVKSMQREFDSRPPDMWAGIGPAICQKHYAVSIDVAEKINASVPPSAAVTKEIKGQWYANLPGAANAQLRTMGIHQIKDASLCTACHTEEWYSHRAEAGTTGRFGVFVMLKG
jgi:YfiH family protein